MTGWCPRHDEVVASSDGLCPKCGAALVVEDVVTEEQATVIDPERPAGTEAQPIPPARLKPRRTPSVVWIAVALTAAFIAGLAFPDVKGADTARAPSTKDVSADLNVGITRNAVGLSLRLESFTQKGRRIIARVSVPEPGDFRLGDVRSALVALRTGAAGGEIFEEIEARGTTSGFILEGDVVPAPNVAVLGLRIDTLNLSTRGTDETELDLAGVWPATRSNQPRAKRAFGRVEPIEGMRRTVTGLIGWADRLDVGISGSALGNVFVDERWELISETTSVPALTGGGDGLVTFIGVPESFRRVKLRVTIASLGINGLWEWSFV